jgi:TctA family transporter
MGLEAVLHAAWEGLRLVVTWPNILYPVLATFVAMVFALLPGLSGHTLLALAVTLTLTWDPLHVMLVFGALVGAATYMGSVSAILFNVPGSAASAATLIDGHPLARQGQARTALGAAALSSALGSTFGVLVLVLLIPFMRRAVLAVGAPELLMLTVWGLATLVVITRASLVKGLAMAGGGLLLSFVGQDPRTGEARYTLGLPYLWDGLALAPVLLGVFSVAEMIDLFASGRRTVSGRTRAEELGGSARAGMRAVFRHFPLLLRSSAIGTVIRGVIAPEASHDAKDGGSLVPTLAFGIPGNEGTALLLAALVLHGLPPGRELMTSHLSLVFVLVWSLFLSNWLTSIVGLASVRGLARLTILPTAHLVPVVFTAAALGAYIHEARMADVFVVFLFGIAGYYLKKHGWPRIALVIALTLGGLFEANFHITARLASLGRLDVWSRPLVLALVVFTLCDLALPWLGRRRAPSTPGAA